MIWCWIAGPYYLFRLGADGIWTRTHSLVALLFLNGPRYSLRLFRSTASFKLYEVIETKRHTRNCVYRRAGGKSKRQIPPESFSLLFLVFLFFLFLVFYGCYSRGHLLLFRGDIISSLSLFLSFRRRDCIVYSSFPFYFFLVFYIFQRPYTYPHVFAPSNVFRTAPSGRPKGIAAGFPFSPRPETDICL